MHMASMRESETFEQTVHREEQNRMHMVSMRESQDSDQFHAQVQLHALLRRGFGTSVPFI